MQITLLPLSNVDLNVRLDKVLTACILKSKITSSSLRKSSNLSKIEKDKQI